MTSKNCRAAALPSLVARQGRDPHTPSLQANGGIPCAPSGGISARSVSVPVSSGSSGTFFPSRTPAAGLFAHIRPGNYGLARSVDDVHLPRNGEYLTLALQ